MAEEITGTPVPLIRSINEFPPEHMRVIGEICVFWTVVEAIILQATAEILRFDRIPAVYFGVNVPAGTRIEMLQTICVHFKADDAASSKEFGTQMLKHIEKIRKAYLLRNKYAHARLRSAGPSKDPIIQIETTTKRVETYSKVLPLSEIIKDADEMYESGLNFLRCLQANGFCKDGAWL